jgi:hypothetical protein
MRDFLQALFETGRVSVMPEPRTISDDLREQAQLARVVADFDRVARLNMAHQAPEVSLRVALWAARLLHDSCQLLVLRNLGERQISAVLTVACPELPSAKTAYSADLFLRYLPSLLDLARRLAPGDPLVPLLEGVGLQWPLSCVAMRLKTRPTGNTSHILAHPGLLQLYVDRIIEHRSYYWIDNPVLVQAVRASYGDHPELCPDLVQAIELLLSGKSLPQPLFL